MKGQKLDRAANSFHRRRTAKEALPLMLDKGHVIRILEFLGYSGKPKVFKAQKGQTEAQMRYSTWAKYRKIIFLIALEIFQRVV